uniref:DUF1176 domain-containing protein n=2 Tax=Aureimonas frigidaquae TaxID=424757 RepID=A0A0P0Z475_9HYPH|nr:hypothetical protein precursor [Aureimonas frigidaquae]
MFRPVLMLGLAALPLAPIGPADAKDEAYGTLKLFGDWIVGCNNLLSCTAIGMVPEAAAQIAYIKVQRGASASATPAISVVIFSDDARQKARVGLTISGGHTTLPLDEMTLNGADNYLRGDVGPDVSEGFLVALLSGQDLDLQIDGESEPVPVSLRGMSAALRYMDAEQSRAGGVTALVAKGSKPSSAVPTPPQIAPLVGQMLTDVGAVAATPKGLPARGDGCPDEAQAQEYKAGDGQIVFGICRFLAAYNAGTEFWTVDGGVPRQFHFPVTGGDVYDVDGLINAGLDDNGLTMTEFAQGRGLGDCGRTSSWAFTGTSFQRVALTEMSECRGVSIDDWPNLYSRDVIAAAAGTR